VPDARFAVAAFRESHAAMARKLLESGNAPAVSPTFVDIHVGRTPELMHLADCCMACSGSVSMELLYHQKPTVILYWISRTAFFAQSLMRKVKYITLVNLLASGGLEPKADSPAPEEMLFPEFLTCEDKSAEMAAHVTGWLTNRGQREAVVAELAALKARVANAGASARAAEYILERL
jgi:lipid-A-disaccharide synthase